MKLATLSQSGILYISIMISASLICLTIKSQTADLDRFQLIILKQTTFDLGLGYEAGNAFSILLSEKHVDNLFIVGLNEIESYDWQYQSITLTRQATKDLSQALSLNPELDKGIADLNAMKQTLVWGSELEHQLYARAFVGIIDSRPTYGGIFLDAMSQMAIRFPVIRVGFEDGKAIFNILPVHIPFLTYDVFLPGDSSCDRAIVPEGRHDWKSLPEEIKENMIKSYALPQIQKMRQCIQNPAIWDIMEKAGKLKE